MIDENLYTQSKNFLLWKLKNVLKGELTLIKDNKGLLDKEKHSKINVVEHFLSYISNYDKNIQLLSEYEELKKRMMKMKDKDIIKQQIIEEITKFLQVKGENIRSSNKSLDIQVTQMDILLDTMHFLQDYDENVKILNEYRIRKNYQNKFKETLDNEER